MTERFKIDNNISLDGNKINTSELSTLVDTENKTFYFIVDSLANVGSFCDRLNSLNDENKQLKKQITSLSVKLDTYKHPLWSTREAERKVSELTELLADEVKKNGELLKENNLLRIENKRLKEVQKHE